MHDSAHTDHARHDLTLIAGHAAGDLSNLGAADAAALLSACTDCAQIHRDLVAISAATRVLPRDGRAPRDFRLTAEQADRLRRGSWLRSLLRPFASARSATRPLATAFTALGLAGVLLAVLAPALMGGLGGAASAPGARDSLYAGAAATNAPAEAPANPELDKQSGGAPGAVAAPTGSGDFGNAHATELAIAVEGDGSSGTPDGDVLNDLGTDPGESTSPSGPTNPILVGSLALVAIGLALFGLRIAARRVR